MTLEQLLFDEADDDDELLVGLILFTQSGMVCPPSSRFTITSFQDVDCRHHFRFDFGDLARLVSALRMPEKLVLPDGSIAYGEECFLIMLKRLAYPSRLHDLSLFFEKSVSFVSYAVNAALKHVVGMHPLLLQFDHERIRPNLEQYNHAVKMKGCTMDGIVGFIDGTARSICRPSKNQKLFYSGHKRTHCLKFQSVTLPDGIIAHWSGPYTGNRHDAGIFRESGISDMIGPYLQYNSKIHITFLL